MYCPRCYQLPCKCKNEPKDYLLDYLAKKKSYSSENIILTFKCFLCGEEISIYNSNTHKYSCKANPSNPFNSGRPTVRDPHKPWLT